MSGGHRVVTLKGPGGIGKTRLADEALSGLRAADWPGGIWRCSLASARNQSDLIEAMRAVFNLRLSDGRPIVQLGEALRVRGRCVLLLDNLEQVVEAVGEVIEGITALAPELSILATSRTSLGLAEESVIELGPIDVDSATALFVDRAQAVTPNFIPTQAELERTEANYSH